MLTCQQVGFNLTLSMFEALSLTQCICGAGALMGVVASGLAVYFMEAHKYIKKAYHKCGLDVRPKTAFTPACRVSTETLSEGGLA